MNEAMDELTRLRARLGELEEMTGTRKETPTMYDETQGDLATEQAAIQSKLLADSFRYDAVGA
jgi:hypothetical protein